MLSHHARKEVSTDPNYDVIRSREWGLAILDEVHVAAAKTWNTVFVDSRWWAYEAINKLHIHTKLGLTATLVREDNGIEDIHLTIGPRLYEANWMKLTDVCVVFSNTHF